MSDRQPDYEFLATHDPLTGLPNRLGWEMAIEDRREAIEAGGPYAIGVSDLDEFKAVNDTLGHTKGDEVIQNFGQILVSNTRQSTDSPHQDVAAVARSGGDEMWLLFDMSQAVGGQRGVTELTMEERVSAVTDRIRGAFDTYVRSDEDLQRLRVGVSIGWSVAREGVAVEQLMEEADEMAHQDKRNRLPELSQDQVNELHVVADALDELGIEPRRLPLFLEKYPRELE